MELYGFKSFADKIELNFEGGITAIVGPNGSGKSNISDAIRWVLGEQSVKSLRGNKMEDVIFAGTKNRKPLNMTEISLTLDNSSQLLPIEFDEVTIARRMYRTGESEYYLNKSLCRLRDIRELLMDTGIGKEGYSIIGQGKIDEILSSRPDDRRFLFEEAVGIVKYKYRKTEAEKKLDSTKENLIRVSDILKELEKQLQPLKEQREKAEKFLKFKKELLKYETNLCVNEIDKIDGELKHINKQMEMLSSSLQTQKSEKKILNMKLNDIQSHKDAIENRIMELQNQHFESQQEISNKQGMANVKLEKKEHYRYNINRLKKESQLITKNKKEIKKKLDDKYHQVKTLEANLEAIGKITKQDKRKYELIISKNESKKIEMEKLKSHIIDILNIISEKKIQANSYKTLLKTMEERIEQIKIELDNQEKDIKKIRQEERVIECNLNNIDSKLDGICKKINHLEANEAELLQREKHIVNQLDNINARLQHKISRKNVLKAMEATHEGYSKGVRNILRLRDGGTSLAKGIHGTVADLIKVTKSYELAIEIALGASIQNVVIQKEEVGKLLINILKKDNLGRVTFLPITSIKDRSLYPNERRIIGGYKDAKIAMEVIDFDYKYRNIFSYLLNRVLIVPDMDLGIQLARELNYRLRIVTIDGDIINIGGSMTGGSSRIKDEGILSRRRELKELKENIMKLDKELKLAKKEYDGLLELKNKLAKESDCLNKQEREVRMDKLTLINKAEQNCKESENSLQAMKRLEGELEDLEEAKATTLEKSNTIYSEIRSMEAKNKELEDGLKKNEQALAMEKDDLEELSKKITENRIEYASLQEQKKAALQEIENLQEAIGKQRKQLEEKEGEIITNRKKKALLKIELDQNTQRLKELSLKTDKINRISQEKNMQKQELEKLIEDKIKSSQQIEEIINELRDGIHKLDVKSTKLEMQQQVFYNKLWEEYELTYKEAIENKHSIAEGVNIAQETRKLKEKIRSLGDVSLNSIEEYDEVKERYDFLTEQKNDLTHAGLNLRKVIKDIERTMENQFTKEFDKIKISFNKVFQKLFGGGKAELVLVDKDNILDSGIDIIAQPPGKKLQNLLLLSGGEKALTAIALLFGILLVKPSPFCILDEIEAALDDVNVNRFAKFLQELSSDTQFVVITHRQGTMEKADVLYGVSMEEEGVSKLVSVKLADRSDDEIAS